MGLFSVLPTIWGLTDIQLHIMKPLQDELNRQFLHFGSAFSVLVLCCFLEKQTDLYEISAEILCPISF